MTMKKTMRIVALCAINLLFRCNAEQELFLENNYGAPIYFQTANMPQAKILQNTQRVLIGKVRDKPKVFVQTYTSLPRSLDREIHDLFLGINHPDDLDSDGIIQVNPSSFYEPWRISRFWEEKAGLINVDSFEDMANEPEQPKPVQPKPEQPKPKPQPKPPVVRNVALDSRNKTELLQLLTFIKKPQYKQGKNKNTIIVTPEVTNRTNDKATNMAIRMLISESYDYATLYEIFEIVKNQIPFHLSYETEVALKTKALQMLASEIKRLRP